MSYKVGDKVRVEKVIKESLTACMWSTSMKTQEMRELFSPKSYVEQMGTLSWSYGHEGKGRR